MSEWWQVQKVLERLKNQFITLMSQRLSNGPLSCQSVSRLSHSACKIARNDPVKDIIIIDRIQQVQPGQLIKYLERLLGDQQSSNLGFLHNRPFFRLLMFKSVDEHTSASNKNRIYIVYISQVKFQHVRMENKISPSSASTVLCVSTIKSYQYVHIDISLSTYRESTLCSHEVPVVITACRST